MAVAHRIAAPRPGERPDVTVRVGISGWNYAPWRGVFYPKGLPHSAELAHACHTFRTIEINGSFYSLMRPETYSAWYRAAPPGFVFSVKGGRFVTHMKRLRDVDAALANFFASGVLCLAEKLGPVLWQLPPTLEFDPALLESFFALLPQSAAEASRLAARHDPRLRGRAAVEAPFDGRLRHAIEVRHESFCCPAFVDLLRRYSIASCVADTAGKYPVLEDLTADFAYVRLHGSQRIYTSGYGNTELTRWADRIRHFAAGEDAPHPHLAAPGTTSGQRVQAVYVYFDNDAKVRAPFDAQNLERILRGERPRRLPRALASVSGEPRP
jgi:uncharacterized protein YecE (DUF72 family)